MNENEKIVATVAAGLTVGIVIGVTAAAGVRKLISDRAEKLMREAAEMSDLARKTSIPLK